MVTGLSVFLRLATLNDCEFIFETRKDPERSLFLGGEPDSVPEQAAWLQRYFLRHLAGEEYYFVICDSLSGSPCGLLRLYEVQAEHCTWGSWVLIASRPSGAAIKSAYLSFEFVFNVLGLASTKLRVHKHNNRALYLYMLFGFEVSVDLIEEYEMILSSSKFFSQKEHWLSLLSGAGAI